MRTTPPTHRDLRRAGCVDEAHVRFGRRAGETHRWKHRQGAPVRPHHVNIRLEEHKLCLLVMIGVRADGRKELIALADGYRESAESWADLLRDCARRGMRAPVLAVGDGALGFWGALREVFPAGQGGSLLVPQDGQCPGRAAQVRSPGRQEGPGRDLGRRGQGPRPGGGEGVRGRLRGEVPQGRREDHRRP